MLLLFSMPQLLCPVCRIEGTLLEHSSQDAVVDYFRCSRCGRIWTHRKGNSNSTREGRDGAGEATQGGLGSLRPESVVDGKRERVYSSSLPFATMT